MQGEEGRWGELRLGEDLGGEVRIWEGRGRVQGGEWSGVKGSARWRVSCSAQVRIHVISVALEKVAFFSDLTQQQRYELAQIMETQSFDANQIIFEEGEVVRGTPHINTSHQHHTSPPTHSPTFKIIHRHSQELPSIIPHYRPSRNNHQPSRTNHDKITRQSQSNQSPIVTKSLANHSPREVRNKVWCCRG